MLDKLLGNKTAKDTIRRLLAAGRIPHSLLLTGEEGVGKRLFALEIAKALVCRNTQNNEACDECPACKRAVTFVYPKEDDKSKDEFKRIVFSGHADVGMVIPFRRNILVDAVRNLEREANFRPYEAEARIFIIDRAERMNQEASNALLKTLEEPAVTSYIFLITSQASALLPTIRSRCQKINFVPVEARLIEEYLVEAKQYSTSDAALVARLARGSIARALSIDLENFVRMRELMLNVVESAALHREFAPMLRAAEEIGDPKNKDAYEDTLEILQTLIRDVLILKYEPASEKIVNADLIERLVNISVKVEAERLANWQHEIEELRGNLMVNINRKIATDALFARMTAG